MGEGFEYCRLKEILEVVRVTRMTIYRWMQKPLDPFPQPMRMSNRCLVWRRSEVSDWLARR